jgi:hypothetical protein
MTAVRRGRWRESPLANPSFATAAYVRLIRLFHTATEGTGVVLAIRFRDTAAKSAVEGDTTLAREKNTSRSEARRRTREAQRAEVAELTEDGQPLEAQTATDTAPTERKPLFKLPNIREDIRLLPEIFRTKRMVYLPLVILLVGLPIFVLFARNQLAPEVATIAYYYVQFFFAPPALFTFFLAGFFVPRGAYLVGFIYGIIAGAIWSVGFALAGPANLSDPSTPSTAPVDMVVVVGTAFLYGILYGTLAAALASWYRGFLTGMQERGKQRRQEREVDERAKRAAQRQEARKVAKQRPT